MQAKHICFTLFQSVCLAYTHEHCPGGIICVLWFGARLVVENKLSPGELSTFVIYAVYVGSNVGALAGIVSSLVQVHAVSTVSHNCAWKTSERHVLMLPAMQFGTNLRLHWNSFKIPRF